MSKEDIITCITEETGISSKDMHPFSTLISLGLDSLEAAALILELEDRFGVDLDCCDLNTNLSELMLLCEAA